MNFWQVISSNGSTFVQTSETKCGPRFRVDIVCDGTGGRELAGQFIEEREADELADWFGRSGPVRAEVTRIGRAA